MAGEGQVAAPGTAEGAQGGSTEGSEQGSAAPATAAPEATPSILDGKTFKTTSGDGTVTTSKGSESLADLKSGEGSADEGAGKDESKQSSEKVEESETSKTTEGKDKKQDEGKAAASGEDDLHQEGDPSGVTKRIDRAVKGQREAERKAEVLAQEKADLERRLAAKPGDGLPDGGDGEPAAKADETAATDTGKPQRPAVPKMDAFDNVDEYEEAREKYDGEALPKYFEDLSAWNTQQAQTTWQAEQTAMRRKEEDQRRIDEAVKVHPDFVAIALENGLNYTPEMADTIFGSEKFVELAYHMGMHPEEVERIHALPATRQVYEIAKIELGLKPDGDNTTIVTDNKPGDAAAKAAAEAGRKRKTAAEEPITPIGGGGTAAPFDVSTASPAAIKAHLEAKQIAEMRGSGSL